MDTTKCDPIDSVHLGRKRHRRSKRFPRHKGVLLFSRGDDLGGDRERKEEGEGGCCL